MQEKTLIVQGKTDRFVLGNIPKYIQSCIHGGAVRKRKGEKPLLPEQKSVLEDYYVHLVTEKGKVTSPYSYYNMICKASKFGQFIDKPYNEAVKDDLKRFFFHLSNSGYAESTINEYRIKLKLFFKFLYQTDDYPPLVKWIEFTRVKQRNRGPEELLSKKDISKLIEAATTPRDKAFIAVLYESAARRGEILSTSIKHVIPDRFGIKLFLPESKTERRSVRLIHSVPYLQQWINHHPNKSNPEAPLFVSLGKLRGNRLTAGAIQRLLRTLRQAAKLHKKVYPHLFRHSRLNELAKSGLNERDLRLIAGWSEDSSMPKTYLHYGHEELDRKLLERAGVQIEKEEGSEQITELKPVECPKCRLNNPSDSAYCSSCGCVLDLKRHMRAEEEAQEKEEKLLKAYGDIMSDPQRRKEFERFKALFLAGSDAP